MKRYERMLKSVFVCYVYNPIYAINVILVLKIKDETLRYTLLAELDITYHLSALMYKMNKIVSIICLIDSI
jgi:hypothetical protein